MSTVDSLLILASSAVVRDFGQKILGAARGAGRLSRYGRIATAVVGVVAIPFALYEPPLLFWFMLFAWSGPGRRLRAGRPLLPLLEADDASGRPGRDGDGVRG